MCPAGATTRSSPTPTASTATAVIDLMKRGMQARHGRPARQRGWPRKCRTGICACAPAPTPPWRLAMLNVIINEDLYDHDFVEKWCYGFDELAERVQEYPPDKVAEITWVPEDKIVARRPPARRRASTATHAVGRCRGHDARGHAGRPGHRGACARSRATWTCPGGMIVAPSRSSPYSGGWGRELHRRRSRRPSASASTDYPLLQPRLRSVAQPDETVEDHARPASPTRSTAPGCRPPMPSPAWAPIRRRFYKALQQARLHRRRSTCS